MWKTILVGENSVYLRENFYGIKGTINIQKTLKNDMVWTFGLISIGFSTFVAIAFNQKFDERGISNCNRSRRCTKTDLEDFVDSTPLQSGTTCV